MEVRDPSGLPYQSRLPHLAGVPPAPCKQAVSLHLNLSIHKFEREQDLFIRACLHEGGGTQVGEVTRLGGVTRLSM